MTWLGDCARFYPLGAFVIGLLVFGLGLAVGLALKMTDGMDLE